jgi:hypothetical protein
MDFINTYLFKYLQNHPTYKFFCCNGAVTKFVNEDNRLKYVPHVNSSKFEIDIYIEIVPRVLDGKKSIYVNIWGDPELHFYCYSENCYGNLQPVKYSEFFAEYPTLPTNIDYDSFFFYGYQPKKIIEILEKFQILNPEYRDKQFNNITLKCVQTIICIQNVLYNDLVFLIIKLLLKLLPHNDDFVWHKKNQFN